MAYGIITCLLCFILLSENVERIYPPKQFKPIGNHNNNNKTKRVTRAAKLRNSMTSGKPRNQAPARLRYPLSSAKRKPDIAIKQKTSPKDLVKQSLTGWDSQAGAWEPDMPDACAWVPDRLKSPIAFRLQECHIYPHGEVQLPQ